MKKKEIFDNYLTNHYSKCEKTNFTNKGEVLELLKKNLGPINHNLKKLFISKIGKKAKILDLGCGYGSFLYFVKSLGYQSATGIDISSEEISLCKKLFKSYKFYQKDIFDYIKATGEKFDVIYLSHVLEHIEKKQLFHFLKSVKKILSNKGFFIIVAPNSAAYFNSLAARYGDLTHETGFTDKSLSQALMLSGFKNIEIKNFFGVGNPGLNVLRKITLLLFEIFIQILGYDKQDIYTPSILVIARK